MMTNVNKTLFIPLYGKAYVSKKHIILNDPTAEKIWEAEAFPIRGKSKSKWLCYNMAMRARIFDDWTGRMLKEAPDALVLHIGCGLDSRCKRIGIAYKNWYDCDFPDVISARQKYYEETDNYHMITLNAADPAALRELPDSAEVIVVFEGISMYLTESELRGFFAALQEKYEKIHVLMDVYTVFGAKASKYKNPINDVGVTKVYGIDDMDGLLNGLSIRVLSEHSLTPERLVNELSGIERSVFKLLFTGKAYRKIYRLYELGND